MQRHKKKWGHVLLINEVALEDKMSYIQRANWSEMYGWILEA